MDNEASNLAKEVLIILFQRFPDQFVLVGGGALFWVYQSPRRSVDIDLKPLRPVTPKLLKSAAEVLEKRLAPVAVRLGLAALRCEALTEEQAIRVQGEGRPLLRIDFASNVPVSGKEKHLIQGDSLQSEIVVTPDIHQLLFAKAAAFLKRPQVKGRDVFDIWFLRERGGRLDAKTFENWLKWEEIDAGDIQRRLDLVTPKRLKADLAPFLPDSIRKSLEGEAYGTLNASVWTLFQPFL